MTMLVTTHDMGEADELCDRIALMYNGRIEVTGSPAELKAQVEPGATLDDVFAHFVGVEIQPGGGYREAQLARQSIREHR